MKTNTKNSNTNQLTKMTLKKQVSHKWNSTLFFQIGLIVSIVAVGLAVELVKFETVNYGPPKLTQPDDVVFTIHSFAIEKPMAKAEKPKPKVAKPIRDLTKLVVVKNSAAGIETKITADRPVITVDPNAKIKIAKPKADPPVKRNMINVQVVPIFPGCEGISDRQESIDCLTRKLHSFIGRRFDTDLAARENLKGTQRIFCTFTIDADGNIVNIQAKAKNSKLVQEAKKVIGKVPSLIPGMQGTQKVPVDFSIPIIFEVQD